MHWRTLANGWCAGPALFESLSRQAIGELSLRCNARLGKLPAVLPGETNPLP